MEITCIAFIATSLDGYIAKPDGDVNWLHNPKYEIPGEDFGYNDHINNIDALVMGRNTFDLVCNFDEWPYNGKHVYVLSTTLTAIPDKFLPYASILSGEIDAILNEIERQGHTRLYIDGGKTIHNFLLANRLDEITITRIPVVLGNGIPLFGNFDTEIQLNHIFSKSYANGFVQSRYSIDRNA